MSWKRQGDVLDKPGNKRWNLHVVTRRLMNLVLVESNLPKMWENTSQEEGARQ